MKELDLWFRQEWSKKGFRTLIAAMLILTLVLGIEFYLFQYAILKSMRYLILFWFLGMFAWIDQKSRRIPNKGLMALLLIRTGILLVECIIYREFWISIISSAVLGFSLGGGMFLLCFLLARGGLGAGDVKLFAVVGYCVGGGTIFTLVFLTVMMSAIYSIVALLLKKVSFKQELPFAPFVFAGTILTMMLGV